MINIRQAIVPSYLLLCFLLGGASAAGYASNGLLQLLAIPIIVSSLTIERRTPTPAPGRQLLALAAAMIMLVLIHLLPLPSTLWSGLPGRADIAASIASMGAQPLYPPLSLAPYRSISSAIWLIPALAVLLGTVKLGGFTNRSIAWVIVGVSLGSVPVAVLQLSGGDDFPLSFYSSTGLGFGTGFFSNANHQATLLVCSLPFLASIYLSLLRRQRSNQGKASLKLIFALVVAVVLVGLVVNGSLAGLGLAPPVAAASLFLIWSSRRKLPLWTPIALLILTICSAAIVLAMPLGNNLTGAEAASDELSRRSSFSRTAQAAGDFLPTGAGIGTFQLVYPTYENPERVTPTYMNHAHNDYLELALEAGVPGVLLILLFFGWWAYRVRAIWGAGDHDHYSRAATIASAAILFHSAVDYPLRTAAISALFAVCCGLMAESRPAMSARASSTTRTATSKAKHMSAD